MEEIKGFVITLVSMIILISAIELISPDNSMKKYLKFVLGTILISVMISPIVSFISNGEDTLSKKISEYTEFKDEKSIKTDNDIKESTSEIMFKENLEENCNRILQDEFPDLEFKSTIDCEVNLQDITYSINKVSIGVASKKVSKIEKIVINNDKSAEVNSNDEKIDKEDEIINYLSEVLNITNEKINVYKLN